jgi:Rps23 Pro-64 3,4-dihydroxylase Tpa1-like proline 4-hydroxylase
MINFSFYKNLKTEYNRNTPFPNIIIDDLFPDYVLKEIYNEVRLNKNWQNDSVDWTQKYQVNKFYWPHDEISAKSLHIDLPQTHLFLKYLNSKDFISKLSELTGIPNLVGDEDFFGGGIHKINKGGKLDLHRDYNVHPTKKLYRRLNLLIYLNENWNENWGGNLELWDNNLTNCVKSIEPIFGRVVIFTISDDAIHGHPKPLNCPENISRYSLALYYFTEEKPKETNDHSVVFFDSN